MRQPVAHDAAHDGTCHGERARGRARGRPQRPGPVAARHRARLPPASAAGRNARQQGRADAREDVLRAALRRGALQFPRRRSIGRQRSTTASARPTTRLPCWRSRAGVSAKRCRSRSRAFRSARSCRRASPRACRPSASCSSAPPSTASPCQTVPADTIVIHGEEDDVVPLADVFAWARPQQLPIVVFPGCGHFFHGRLPQLARIVTALWPPQKPRGDAR